MCNRIPKLGGESGERTELGGVGGVVKKPKWISLRK